VKRAQLLVASCLWFAASGIPAWAAERTPATLCFPAAFFPSEDKESRFNLNVEDFRIPPFGRSFSPALNESDAPLRGLEARYQMGRDSLEISGGYIPGMKAVFSSESQLDPDAYLSYVNLKIPLYRFYFSGGAFFGQNLDALGLIGQTRSEERGLRTSLFGYQVGGGYKFNETLSVQAGWGQAAQEYDVSRDDLRAWYLQAQISLGWRMSFTPQVGLVDSMNGDGEKTREEAFYCGARWQINF